MLLFTFLSVVNDHAYDNGKNLNAMHRQDLVGVGDDVIDHPKRNIGKGPNAVHLTVFLNDAQNECHGSQNREQTGKRKATQCQMQCGEGDAVDKCQPLRYRPILGFKNVIYARNCRTQNTTGRTIDTISTTYKIAAGVQKITSNQQE